MRSQCARYQELTTESVLRVMAQNYNKTLARRHIHKNEPVISHHKQLPYYACKQGSSNHRIHAHVGLDPEQSAHLCSDYG